jgi:hypothetical protein
MTTTNCYLIEFENGDGCFQYETFLAEDQFGAIDLFNRDFPKCVPYNVFKQLNRDEEA